MCCVIAGVSLARRPVERVLTTGMVRSEPSGRVMRRRILTRARKTLARSAGENAFARTSPLRREGRRVMNAGDPNQAAAGGNVLDFGGIVRAAGLRSVRLKVMKRDAKRANSVAAATRQLLWG